MVRGHTWSKAEEKRGKGKKRKGIRKERRKERKKEKNNKKGSIV